MRLLKFFNTAPKLVSVLEFDVLYIVKVIERRYFNTKDVEMMILIALKRSGVLDLKRDSSYHPESCSCNKF